MRLGILLSGTGSTYANLVERIADGTLDAEIAVVVSSRADAGGLARAAANGHPHLVAREEEAVAAALREHRCELVAMCGWMRWFDPPPDLAGRVLNVHPALLPAFGGEGMYGDRVHRAVLEAGVKVAGCTVHVVAGPYDSGPILAQRTVPVLPGDDLETLRDRVQAAERHLYPRVLAVYEPGVQRLPAAAGCDEDDFGFA